MTNIFHGVPWDHTASVGFDNDPTITYFFRMNPSTNLNEVFIHDETTNTTTISDIGIPTMFPDLPTNIPITHGSGIYPVNPGEHYILWQDNTLSPPLQFIVTTSPTAVPISIGSTNINGIYHTGSSVPNPSTSISWYAILGYDYFLGQRGPGGISHYLPTGNYGGVGQPYAGLPYIAGGTGVETNYCSILRVTGQFNQVYLFTPTGDAIILDLLAQQISSTVPYGPISSAPVVPPTPLPDIEVVYSAPSQFNLFASDVALVTETQYGWNFTKTINDSNKMELYLYHSSAPGAVPFNYNQLRDLRVNMKNNLVLPAGEIFMNVFTGPPVAPNWYNYKDTYTFTPPLGTAIDVNLVEHILNLTDTRTDPIIAISLHSNSAQQQVNCDVEKVSFEILLPATNNSQRVIVKLQNNFIALDNHYWDLDDTATARLNTTIIPAFDIQNFNPNIVAGNFPQNATARESASGCALFVSGTWQLWETTDGTTWTATPNATLTLNAQPATAPVVVPPGPSSNGFAYIGTKGAFDNYGTALPLANRPIVWEVKGNNEIQFIWSGSASTLLAPLSLMTAPNNFTAAEIASGFFDVSVTPGSTALRVFISTDTGPDGGPVASKDIDIVVKSETEISIKRSWELSVTTYIIDSNDPKRITGQYTDPAYTTSVAPTSFSMPTNWLETANNDAQFEIRFSGGLNNSLPAESQNFRQMTVTPTPVNTELTFAWVANYYTAGNILIGPVAGIGTTGLVSGFTTGGSLKPPSASYILYGCTSSQNVDAINSLVFIEPEAEPEIKLIFQTANNQIVADGTYTVAVTPSQTVQYDAVFRDLSGASLGAVPGFGTSGTTSSFTITYSTLPVGVAWIDYQCTDGTNIAQLSITIVPLTAPPAFELTFQTASNQIVADGTYTVTVSPSQTVQYDAVFRDLAGASLGAVPGFGTSGSSSSFTITYATLPAGVAWIDYQGTDGTTTEQLSITIVPLPAPPVPQSFELIFDGGVFPVNITADGTYSVAPLPLELPADITYTYTAKYFAGTTDLGAVVGFDVTGQSSSFPFTFAGMPAGATYIKYSCSASGTGSQNGETADSIIGLIDPSSGGNDDVTNSREQNTIGIYENKDYIGSSKKVMDENISSLELQLVDGNDQSKILINNTINYEIETSFKGEF